MAERFVKQHEEAAERFLTSAVLMLGLAGAGLLRGRLGSLGRAATAVASIGLLVAGIQVGYLGGELVYKHGAGQAYLQATETDMQPRPAGTSPSSWKEDDD